MFLLGLRIAAPFLDSTVSDIGHRLRCAFACLVSSGGGGVQTVWGALPRRERYLRGPLELLQGHGDSQSSPQGTVRGPAGTMVPGLRQITGM